MNKLIVVAAVAALCACNKNVPPAEYIKAVDCQFHVLDKAFKGNTDLINRVLEVGQGPFQVEEFVKVAAELGKNDAVIIETGKALNDCLPPELRAEVVAPPPQYGNKIL